MSDKKDNVLVVLQLSGGNDALILYGIPTLSPYALPAYGALITGVAAGLVLLRLCLRIEARVECRNDIFIRDTWSRPIPPAPNG